MEQTELLVLRMDLQIAVRTVSSHWPGSLEQFTKPTVFPPTRIEQHRRSSFFISAYRSVRVAHLPVVDWARELHGPPTAS